MLALISVYDKQGVVEFAKRLRGLGFDLLSSGGTAIELRRASIPVKEVSDYTGFPEVLDGRVKTLHPKIHAGILAKASAEHEQQLEKLGVGKIDLVAVNFYPFEKAVADRSPMDVLIENIDIGGPSLVRAAAKNFSRVTVVVDPSDYPIVIAELEKDRGVSAATRKKLAEKAFQAVARYDALIANALSSDKFPQSLAVAFDKVQNLRYGENPHQAAALYREPLATGVATAEKLNGKELSYNNVLDADSAFALALDFDRPAAVIVKHNNPCGAAVDDSLAEAYKKAFATDTVSAFGGVVAFNRPVDKAAAEEITKSFIEVVVAPGFAEGALETLCSKKNLRVLRVEPPKDSGIVYRRVAGGLLVQDRNASVFNEFKPVSKRAPSPDEEAAMKFAFTVCKHVKSNAVIFALADRTIGIGAGQMSRVDSARIAVMKAKAAGLETRGCAVASDAFLPFRDTVDVIADAGATALIQPGGSVRDQEVIDAANEKNLAMVFTEIRHFNH
jgi:phosphoribosylaminoimidazolecarboxamide formyltransferase/IMP cyclohydrolase